jgi:peptide-methionine (S)-S-oxide reductase
MRRPAVGALLIAALGCGLVGAQGNLLPPPVVDAAKAPARGRATAVVAGGCFWGVEEVFQHVRGVVDAMSGYAGGSADTAHYYRVGEGDTGHAESVQVVYDPSQITYGQLLRIFLSVAHDPTQVNRQGPDDGPMYRSVIFYANAEQEGIARAYLAQPDVVRAFRRPIATEITKLARFYPAEDDHQDYAAKHPDDPYIRFNDAPKIDNLRRLFPDLFVDR